MTSATTSITSALKSLKSRALGEDAFFTEIAKLADLDKRLDALDRAERIFAVRDRIVKLQKRVRELEEQR